MVGGFRWVPRLSRVVTGVCVNPEGYRSFKQSTPYPFVRRHPLALLLSGNVVMSALRKSFSAGVHAPPCLGVPDANDLDFNLVLDDLSELPAFLRCSSCSASRAASCAATAEAAALAFASAMAATATARLV